jgi:raffinose/stachyose/melibiose transport system permease protein
MRNKALIWRWGAGTITVLLSIFIFVLPFLFILLTASKGQQEASLLQFTLPTEWKLFDNIGAVIESRNFIAIRAFLNSAVLTVASVTLVVVLGAMIGFVLQRRKTRWNGLINGLILAGLIIPVAIVPTIWVMQGIGIFKTLPGLILVEVAFALPFAVLLFRAFMGSVPRELDEAAIIDGAGPIRLFMQIILPLIRPVMITVIVVQSVFIFNDFTYPLYFLPGDQFPTVQLLLYNFSGQNLTQWGLLFAFVLLATIPPLIMYIFFNRQIQEGMTSGSVKG